MAIFHFGTAEAQRWLDAEMCRARGAARRAPRRQLAGGPERAQGSRRSPAGSIPKAAKRIRRYWELQAWLVLEAEETMMEEAAGDVDRRHGRRCAPRFAELDGSKRALGRSTFAALQRAASVQPQRLLGSVRA